MKARHAATRALAAFAAGLLFIALAVATRPGAPALSATPQPASETSPSTTETSPSTSQPGPPEASSPIAIVTTTSYAVSIARDSLHVVAGRPVAISLAVHTLAGDLPMTATAQAFPGTDGEGQPVRVALTPAGRNRYTAAVTFPAVGVWEFDVDAATVGNQPERAVFAIPVASPHALPQAAAWLIALLPLGALALFARAEVERHRALPAKTHGENAPLVRG